MDIHKKGKKKVHPAKPSKEKRGRGRPATGRQRAETILVRFSEKERGIVDGAAEADGMTTGLWLRVQGLKAAGHEPEE